MYVRSCCSSEPAVQVLLLLEFVYQGCTAARIQKNSYILTNVRPLTVSRR